MQTEKPEIFSGLTLNDRDMEVAEKFAALAGMIGRVPAGQYAFEKASFKIIQKMIPDESEQENIRKVRMFIFNDLRGRREAYLTYRNYTEMFGVEISSVEIEKLGIDTILLGGISDGKK